MPNGFTLNPLTLTKLILWILVVVGATVLLTRRQMSKRLRLVFLVGGVLLFGFVYGALLQSGLNPSPPSSVRMFLKGLLVQRKLVVPVVGMLLVLLGATVVSNKAICGYGCQLGLLQDLLHRTRLPKWRPPFWLSNSIRGLAFLGLILGLVGTGFDWIDVIDPFRIFQFDLTVPVVLGASAVLVASLFVYRPWCRFLCPFGLVSWAVEQLSIYRPRINREACKDCKACVRACPTSAMNDFYEGKRLHADCFACGACVEACKVQDALGWRRS